MFSLFSGLWKYIFQKDEYCVLIVGLDNAGKTTLLEQVKRKYAHSYKGIPLEKISSTVGMNVGKIEVGRIRLIFWDLGGQQELQSLWDKYFLDCHGLVYVIDSCDKSRLEESHSVFDGMMSCSELDGVPLLVLANKQDQPDALKVVDVKSVFNASAHLLGHRDCMVQSVSAFNGDGIEAGVDWLVNCVKRNIHRPPREQVIT